MNNFRSKVRLVAAMAVFLAASSPLLAVTISGRSGVARTSASVQTLEGVVSNVDMQQGVLVVSGRSYRMDAREFVFSDARKKLPARTKSGESVGLAAGLKVALRAEERNGVLYAVKAMAID